MGRILSLFGPKYLFPEITDTANIMLIAVSSFEATPDLACRSNQCIAPVDGILHTVKEPRDNQGV
jgi:hypothetical protein